MRSSCCPTIRLTNCLGTTITIEKASDHRHDLGLLGHLSVLPGVADAVSILVLALFAFVGGYALSQSDGDLFAHFRLGQVILAQGRIPTTSVLGFANHGTTAVFPAWLSAVCFATLAAKGGLALVIATTAAVAGLTHGLVAEFLRRANVPPARNVLASTVAFALASAHWLARPHMFSMLFVVLLLLLLHSERSWTVACCAVLFAVWANVHGAWVYGLVIVGCFAVGDAVDWRLGKRVEFRSRFIRHSAALLLSVAGTLLNPYGLGLHRAVLASLSDGSLSRVVDEYRPAGFSSTVDLLFYATVLFVAINIVRNPRRLPFSWLLVAIVSIVFAVVAGRNIALFGLMAWPLLAAHIAAETRQSQSNVGIALRRRRSRFGVLFLPAATIVLALGAMHGHVARAQLIPDQVLPTRFPVEAVGRLRGTPLSSRRILTTWAWSGYVPYALPGTRVFFDPLVFGPTVLDSFGRMLLARSGWRTTLQESGIDLAILPPGLPLSDSLVRDPAWQRWYDDRQALVFIRANRPGAEMLR